jgi:hypothetical protein
MLGRPAAAEDEAPVLAAAAGTGEDGTALGSGEIAARVAPSRPGTAALRQDCHGYDGKGCHGDQD